MQPLLEFPYGFRAGSRAPHFMCTLYRHRKGDIFMTRNNKMDKKKLENYKKFLLKIKEDLVNDIKSMSSNPISPNNDSGDVSGHVQHMADVATDMYDREFNLGLASNERTVLYKIDSALKRIADHSFGICIECDKPISEARLKAIPYTETCLKCQEHLESGKGK